MSSAPSSTEPLIVGADMAAGHDGHADLVLELRFPNGATDRVVVDERTALAVLRRAGVDDVQLLINRSWRALMTPDQPIHTHGE